MDLQTHDPDLQYLCAWLSVIIHQLRQMQRFLEWEVWDVLHLGA